MTTIEIGAYSFGDTQLNPDGTQRSTSEAIKNLFDAIVHADKLGLDYFGVGEHHTVSMPASSPGALLSAAAAATENIILGSAASIISTDDPVRVYQQFATADAISGGGRIEITAGRGSSVETFPLFGYSLDDYDQLYSDKIDLLLNLNADSDEFASWEGSTRPAIDNLAVVPRPDNPLPIWLATGGNPSSTVRAGQLGLPISYGIIGGAPARFAPLADLYRAQYKQSGHDPKNMKVSVAAMGMVAPTKQEALERFYPGWYNLNIEMGRLRGWQEPDPRAYQAQAHAPGAYYIGDPDDVAERIVDLHKHMGHTRHFLQMDVGGIKHEHLMESIELLATEVKPRVERLLAKS